ncbi:MAG: class I SAM-dependent methyltransferase [Methylobacteriaceae bacterium]|nr:class I SAM-dependent methyltransferase [Methylobacteriaceae bacterium]
MLTKAPSQPTDPHLIWGRRRDRIGRQFQARSAIVDHLISAWAKPGATGVDVSGGAGRWLTTLAPHFSQFTHLDLSADALNVARTEHPDLSHVEYGFVDLLNLRADSAGRRWDVAFCLDTLLYHGNFVETALRNIRAVLRPGGIAIIDLPMQFRASISQRIKGPRYRGPERKFSPKAAHGLIGEAGYICLATAYQYSELSVPIHRTLLRYGATALVPWPSTWMYLVLRAIEQQ